MDLTTIRGVLGEPSSWANSICEDGDGIPDFNGSTIVDVFCSGNEIALYTKGGNRGDKVSIFIVRDQGLRERLTLALLPGLVLLDVLDNAI